MQTRYAQEAAYKATNMRLLEAEAMKLILYGAIELSAYLNCGLL